MHHARCCHGSLFRFNPYERFNKCGICKQTVHQKHSHYCQQCAYKNGATTHLRCVATHSSTGICAMCGVKVADTTGQRMSSI